MNRRSKATVLILLVVILAMLGWWVWPRSSVAKVADGTVGAQVQTPKSQAKIAENKVRKASSAAPISPPERSMFDISEKDKNRIADNELGKIEFGVMKFESEGVKKRITLKSGHVAEIYARLGDRSGVVSLNVGIVDPNAPIDEWPKSFIMGSSKPGEPCYVTLDGGETVRFTPMVTVDPNDHGVLNLGEVDLRGGVTKTFTLVSGRKLALRVEVLEGIDLVSRVLDADGNEIQGSYSSFDPETDSGKPQSEELGGEAVAFTPLY